MADGEGLGAHVREQLAPLGSVTVRRMFGGAGVFLDGLMFGLIVDEALYFKANAATQPDFEGEGLAPFSYQRSDGQRTVMSYWRAPERLLDETDEMLIWARKAVAVAKVGAAKAPATRRKGKSASGRGERKPA